MRPPLDGTILITGASSGIGRELARQLAPRAGALVLVARRRERLEELASELRARRADLRVHVVPADLGDRASTDAMLDTVTKDVGDVDVLVNNAGFGDLGAFDLAPWPRLESMIELNVRSPAYLTHRLVHGMIERRRGGILNISSGWGLTFAPTLAAYIGTKHFVSAWSEALRLEVRHLGVTVTHVCPGPVRTEFEENLGNFTGMKIPMEITPDHCARSAIRAFSRGRARVIPGLVFEILLALAAIAPIWLLRLLYRPVASRARKIELEKRGRRRDPEI